MVSRKKRELITRSTKMERKNRFLADDFKEWPLEKLVIMNLDEYVTGKGPQNKSLCYEIEHGKYSDMYLGIRGGSRQVWHLLEQKEWHLL